MKVRFFEKLLCFTMFCFISIYSCYSQLTPVWVNHIGESGGIASGRSIAYDASSNKYVIGVFAGLNIDCDPGAGTAYVSSQSSTSDVWVAKYNSSGAVVWAFAIGGTAGADAGYGISVSGTDVYIIGSINGTTAIDMDPSSNTNTITGAGSNDVFVAKYDGSLTPSNTSFYKWSMALGGTGSDIGYGISVSGSNVYITGNIFGTTAIDMDPSANTNDITGAGSNDIFVAKYNGSLTPSDVLFYQWAMVLGGAAGGDVGYGISVSGSDVYVIGNINGTTAMDMDPSANTNNITGLGGNDVFVAKYDGSLTPSNTSFYQWAFPIGTAVNNDVGYGIAVSGSDVYITGTIFGTTATDMDPSANTNNITGAGSNDVFVAKYDGSLTPSNVSFYQWAFRLGGTGTDLGYGIAVSGSDVYVTGNINGTTAMDMDPSANTNNITGAGANDVFVAKYDGSLLSSNVSFYQWAFRIGGGGTAADVGYAIAATGTDVFLTGAFIGTNVDFDPGAGTVSVSNYVSTTTPFVASYTSGGAINEAFVIGGVGGIDQPRDIAVDASGNIYSIGHFTGCVDFDPGVGVTNLYASDSWDAYVAKYTSSGAFVWAFSIGGTSIDLGKGIAISGTDLYVVGDFNSTIDIDPSTNTSNLVGAGGSYDVFVAKYDLNFTPSSTSFYTWGFSISSGSQETVYGITLDGSDIYLYGQMHSASLDMDPSANTNTIVTKGNGDGYVVKYDGNFAPSSTSFYKWAFNYGSTVNDHCYNIAISGNDLYITGGINGTTALDMDPSTNTNNITGAGSDDIILAKYDMSVAPSSTSFYQWAFRLGGANSDMGYSLLLSGTDLYLIGGFSAGAAIDFDPSANSNTLTSAGSIDGFIVKYDVNVAPSNTAFYVWAFKFGDTGADGFNNIGTHNALLSGNYLYLLGYIGGTNPIDFDPSANTNSITGVGSSDVILAKYDVSLTPSNTAFYRYAFAVGGTGADNPACMAIDAGGDLLLAGYFSGLDTDFDPNAGTILYSSLDNNIFIGKYLASAPLPIELISFTASSINNEYVLLDWVTATEINNDYFSIERSEDGINFSLIATKPGAGNSSTPINYQYIDNLSGYSTLPLVLYYRLKQTDFDGAYTYSDIRAVTFKDGVSFVKVFPNPSNGFYELVIFSSVDTPVSYEVIDAKGSVVYRTSDELFKGVQYRKLDVSTLSPGVYMLNVSGNETQYIGKTILNIL